MTLLCIEGFEARDISLKYSSVTNPAYSSPGRFGYGSYWYASATGLRAFTVNFTASSQVFVGVGCNNSGGSSSTITFYGDAGATSHTTITLNGSGSIAITSGGSVRATSAAGILPVGGWAYLEISVTVSDTVGEVHVRIDGAGTDLISWTGDTKNGGTNTTIDAVRLSTANSSNPQVSFDDLYICNSTGSENNTFLGDVRVVSLLPNGNGDSSQFVRSDSNPTDNYLLVDEEPYNTSDYVGASTSGYRDLYQLGNLPATTSSVLGISQTMIAQKTDAGAAEIKHAIKTGGTIYYSSNITTPASWGAFVRMLELNPGTSALWTTSDVDSLQAGFEIV
jgi:hypothetical protein